MIDSLQKQIFTALQQILTQIRWKPNKAQSHLEKRIRLAHLPPATSLAEYEAIIGTVLRNPEATVYAFQYNNIFYPTIVAPYQGQVWLVMFGMNGIMETSFPPDDPVTYFQDPKYHLLGQIQELYHE
ncbi:MAG: hypothetical protein DYG89_51385 [Caldilinea sp. CFX5]|nr:hypothetical protein [Caldilinea sp. CFX5]